MDQVIEVVANLMRDWFLVKVIGAIVLGWVVALLITEAPRFWRE